ncbi:hypothetical protein AVEN_23166-1 [Araneus ventricosus]|uniref:Tc1-like transposase DDE domain-containing protein n=1 Tax=Araneus ventricosus TaxID=182803 RepID=A0A4Y2FI75_ARAVE|nr:hypothetical protein AVEN_23166-1 [Araneus ventricosus]
MHSDNPGKIGMSQQWLFPQIQQDRDDFIIMQDGAPPHFHHEVQQYLYDTTLTPCDFYLWGYIKDSVYVAAIPATLRDLRDRIVTERSSITRNQILSVWQEMD